VTRPTLNGERITLEACTLTADEAQMLADDLRELAHHARHNAWKRQHDEAVAAARSRYEVLRATRGEDAIPVHKDHDRTKIIVGVVLLEAPDRWQVVHFGAFSTRDAIAAAAAARPNGVHAAASPDAVRRHVANPSGYAICGSSARLSVAPQPSQMMCIRCAKLAGLAVPTPAPATAASAPLFVAPSDGD